MQLCAVICKKKRKHVTVPTEGGIGGTHRGGFGVHGGLVGIPITGSFDSVPSNLPFHIEDMLSYTPTPIVRGKVPIGQRLTAVQFSDLELRIVFRGQLEAWGREYCPLRLEHASSKKVLAAVNTAVRNYLAALEHCPETLYFLEAQTSAFAQLSSVAKEEWETPKPERHAMEAGFLKLAEDMHWAAKILYFRTTNARFLA